MKVKKLGWTIAFCVSLIVMFSSCELLAFIQLGNALMDYNYIYVKNGTASPITVKVVEDPTEVSEGGKVQDCTIKLKKNAVDEKSITGGYFKFSIDGVDVIPDASLQKTPNSNGYYLCYAHSLLTIKSDGNGGYIYFIESRN